MKYVQAATDRLFRDYQKHCAAPDQDTLFHFLNSLHSFNDKLRVHKKEGLFESMNFVGLKALRNLFHHEAELLSKIKIVTDFVQPIGVDLERVCLVERSLVERAAAAGAAASKKRKRTSLDITTAFKWYGEVTDIEPAIFNVVVDAYEAIKALGIAPSSQEFVLFEETYLKEEKEGIDHRVTGAISCHAGNVDQLFQQIISGFSSKYA